MKNIDKDESLKDNEKSEKLVESQGLRGIDLNKISAVNAASLFVKQQSLAAEARIIKHARSDLFNKVPFVPDSLEQHLIGVVRPEARATHLVNAFVRNIPYSDVEHLRRPEKEFDFNRLVVPAAHSMIKRYTRASIGDFDKWLKAPKVEPESFETFETSDVVGE